MSSGGGDHERFNRLDRRDNLVNSYSVHKNIHGHSETDFPLAFIS